MFFVRGVLKQRETNFCKLSVRSNLHSSLHLATQDRMKSPTPYFIITGGIPSASLTSCRRWLQPRTSPSGIGGSICNPACVNFHPLGQIGLGISQLGVIDIDNQEELELLVDVPEIQHLGGRPDARTL
jgi:hypothetical protein